MRAYVGAIAVVTAATSQLVRVGGEIKSFLLDNRSGATIYVNYDGTRDYFRAVWPGDHPRIVVTASSVQGLWVYASAATAAGEVEIDIEIDQGNKGLYVEPTATGG